MSNEPKRVCRELDIIRDFIKDMECSEQRQEALEAYNTIAEVISNLRIWGNFLKEQNDEEIRNLKSEISDLESEISELKDGGESLDDRMKIQLMREQLPNCTYWQLMKLFGDTPWIKGKEDGQCRPMPVK